MNEKTPLMNLMEAASVANLVHFPQGVVVARASSSKPQWFARVIGKDLNTGEDSSLSHYGPTPEAAIEALRLAIVKRLKDDADRSNREGDSKRAAIRLVEAAL